MGERRVFVADGKGGRQRLIPMAPRFFATLGRYLDHERPKPMSTSRVFVVLTGPRRGQPLSASGLDQIISGARRRAGLRHATCHELRHTCLTQFQPGHVDRGHTVGSFRMWLGPPHGGQPT